MSQPVTDPTAPANGQVTPPATPPATPAAAPAAAPATPGDPALDALGDPGKRALDAMKAERNQARQEATSVRAELDALKAQIAGREQEHKAAVEAQRLRDEARVEADKRANQRILSAEVRAAAAGKLADPADALRYIDLSSFEVKDDGLTDSAAIAKAVDDLIASKPYLAAATAPKWPNIDANARNGNPPSLDQQIQDAHRAGQHALAIALKRQAANTTR